MSTVGLHCEYNLCTMVGMASWKRTIDLKDCGNSWCTGNSSYGHCEGHIIEMDYSTVTNIGSISVDGKMEIIGGDNIFTAIAKLIEENPYL